MNDKAKIEARVGPNFLLAAKPLHLADILQEEMDERGWTRDDLAVRMGPTHDDFGVNRLALDMFMEVRKVNVILGEMDAQFAIAFGVSKEFFNNFHEAWRAANAGAVRKNRRDESPTETPEARSADFSARATGYAGTKP